MKTCCTVCVLVVPLDGSYAVTFEPTASVPMACSPDGVATCVSGEKESAPSSHKASVLCSPASSPACSTASSATCSVACSTISSATCSPACSTTSSPTLVATLAATYAPRMPSPTPTTIVASIKRLSPMSPPAISLSARLLCGSASVCTSLIIEGMPVVASSACQATFATTGAAVATAPAAACAAPEAALP